MSDVVSGSTFIASIVRLAGGSLDIFDFEFELPKMAEKRIPFCCETKRKALFASAAADRNQSMAGIQEVEKILMLKDGDLAIFHAITALYSTPEILDHIDTHNPDAPLETVVLDSLADATKDITHFKAFDPEVQL